MTFMDQSLGIENITYTGANVEPDGINPGVVHQRCGTGTVKGNRGTINDFEIPVGSLKLQNGNTVNLPFTKTTLANGESTATIVHDLRLGGDAPHDPHDRLAAAQTTTQSTYHFTLESADQINDESSASCRTRSVLSAREI